MEQIPGMDWIECDLCSEQYRAAYMEIVPLDHLVAWKARLCMDCIRAAAAYDDGEEVGTGGEGMVRSEGDE